MSWVYSQTDEWFSSEEFDTREDAVTEGLAEARVDERAGCYVGELRRFSDEDFPAIFTDIEDHLACWLYDIVGERASDGWPDICQATLKLLEAEMNNMLLARLREIGAWPPDRYAVDNIEFVEAQ
jgi:hypothetical protein